MAGKYRSIFIKSFAVAAISICVRTLGIGIFEYYQSSYADNLPLKGIERHVIKVTFPQWSSLSPSWRTILINSKNVDGNYAGYSGEQLYNKLDQEPAKKAALLNLLSKADHTKIGRDKSNVTHHILSITYFAQDRIFVVTDSQLARDIAVSIHAFQVQNPLDNASHKRWANFDIVENVKTPDERGNLQIVVARNKSRRIEVADIDEDECLSEACHLVTCAMHMVLKQETDPFNMRTLLVRQGIIPPYTLNLDHSRPVVQALNNLGASKRPML